MLALPIGTFGVHATELRRIGRGADVVDIGSIAGSQLAAAREAARSDAAAVSRGDDDGSESRAAEIVLSENSASSTNIFAFAQLEDAARRLRAMPALSADDHAAALLDGLDRSIARLKFYRK
jgi:hypothetical protein